MPIELPHSGTLRASGTCVLMNANVSAPARLEGHRRRPDRVEQPALGVHVDDDRLHQRERLLGLVHDQVGSLGNDVQTRRR